jgi:hypothetical protein
MATDLDGRQTAHGPVRAFRNKVRKVLPDAVVAIRAHKAVHGTYPAVFRPVAFNEKVLFRKLFDRRPILVRFHDKLRVRDYVADRLGAAVLPVLHFAGDRPETIPFDTLPDRFVVKPGHASGLVRIVTDRQRLDPRAVIEECRAWLRHDYYRQTREWVYRHIPPRIMVEEFIDDGSGAAPKDYKFFVFDGRVRLIQVDAGRFTEHRRSFYDTGWRRLDFTLRHEPIAGEVARPRHLAAMLAAAECLGAGMDFVRVDLYDTGSRFYFGEITTCPGSGLERFHPVEYDRYVGAFWRLAGTRS